MKINEKAGYPRPDFIRENYMSLNGDWHFAYDDDGTVKKRLAEGTDITLPMTVKVPFVFQSGASGICSSEKHERVCYRKKFITENTEYGSVLLHFGAVDREAEVWFNGRYVGSHTGGYTPFCFNVGGLLNCGENEITVYVTDEFRPDTVRGKQIWNGEPWGCHYTAVTGIWQDVWLEFTSADYITDVNYVTDFDSHSVTAETDFSKSVCGYISAVISKNGEEYMTVRQSVRGRTAKFLISFEDCGVKDKEAYTWSPSHPNLFDVSLTLETDTGTDTVETYFGIRKAGTYKNRFYLNNSQYYLRMVLDQGYWADGIYRPEDTDGYRKDVELTLALGFNGARKHQKIEDPKYYYWADRLGLLVWGELPSFYGFTEYACTDAENTMREFITRDRNHPSVIAWVPFNESWGLRCLPGDSRQSDFAREMYYLCKRTDPSRPVSTNDGWENVFPTDICGIHDYRAFDEKLSQYYSDTSFFDSGCGRTGHSYVNENESYAGQPVMLTEFGGRRADDVEGYVDSVKNDVTNIRNTPTFCGYCFTQLTDVYQESNGLLNMDRTPKADIEIFRKIFSK